MNVEWSVSQARDKFSDALNRAAFGGEVTYVTRGRNRQRAAAIVPAEWVEAYEEMVDREDGAIATDRLRRLANEHSDVIPADRIEQAHRREVYRPH